MEAKSPANRRTVLNWTALLYHLTLTPYPIHLHGWLLIHGWHGWCWQGILPDVPLSWGILKVDLHGMGSAFSSFPFSVLQNVVTTTRETVRIIYGKLLYCQKPFVSTSIALL